MDRAAVARDIVAELRSATDSLDEARDLFESWTDEDLFAAMERHA